MRQVPATSFQSSLTNASFRRFFVFFRPGLGRTFAGQRPLSSDRATRSGVQFLPWPPLWRPSLFKPVAEASTRETPPHLLLATLPAGFVSLFSSISSRLLLFSFVWVCEVFVPSHLLLVSPAGGDSCAQVVPAQVVLVAVSA